jgi:hypothetical protein
MMFKVHTGPSHKSLYSQLLSGMQKIKDVLLQLLVMNFINNKYSVHTFLDKLMQDIIFMNPEVENVTFISDGAASQFKQCFLFANLTFSKERYEVTVSWHFLAASHGKFVVDGIGGTPNKQYG